MTDVQCFITRRRLLLAAVASAVVLPAGGLRAAKPSLPNGVDGIYRTALSRAGALVLVRHALTVPGIGDPPNFRLDDCATQRNLSEEGKAQSRRMGQWFRDRGLTPTRVRSSQWCRCMDTAVLAFGNQNAGPSITIEPWPALNSFFQGHGNRDRQLSDAMVAAQQRAQGAQSGQFEVWVTHQVTVSSLTQHHLAMGEMIVAVHDGLGKPLRVLASGLRF
jgi:broad specificity phosphatase PhoE